MSNLKHNSQHNHREAASRYHELTPCVVSEKNWNTKEDNDKPMMHVLYILRWQNATSWDEATPNSKEIKPIALSIVELCLGGGIGWSVSIKLS